MKNQWMTSTKKLRRVKTCLNRVLHFTAITTLLCMTPTLRSEAACMSLGPVAFIAPASEWTPICIGSFAPTNGSINIAGFATKYTLSGTDCVNAFYTATDALGCSMQVTVSKSDLDAAVSNYSMNQPLILTGIHVSL